MRKLWLPLLSALLLLSACSSDQPVPAAPDEPGNLVVPPGCPTPAKLTLQIGTLVLPGQGRLATALFKFDQVLFALARGNLALARRRMFDLLDYLVKLYNAGQLIGGKSSITQTRLASLTSGLYCLVGLPSPSIDPAALGPDGAIAVVDPASPQVDVVNSVATAGVRIPAGAAPTATLVTMTRLPNAPGPLNTTLDQYPAFYEFKASPPVTFTDSVTVGICQLSNFTGSPLTYARLKLAHNVGAGVEILPRVTATFLNPVTCSSLVGALDRKAGIFQFVLNRLERVAGRVLLPAYADAATLGTCCLGGSSKNFSPFGAVDTLTSVTALTPTSVFALPGNYVAAGQVPSVRVATPLDSGVAGVTVTFVGLPGDSVHSPVQVTDSNGVATLGAWFMTLPSDTVQAIVSFLPGTGVAGSPVTFVATAGPGVEFAFRSARDGDNEIYRMFPNGIVQQLTYNTGIQDLEPAWSPNGPKLAYKSDTTGQWDLRVIDTLGNQLAQLTNDATDDDHPSWSPGGQRIAFQSYRDGNPEIYLTNADGSGADKRLTTWPGFDGAPSYAPDGMHIAFWSDRAAGNWDIYVMDTLGLAVTRLTTDAAIDVEPAWSPDGSRIAFRSTRDGNSEIYVMNADGSGQTRLTFNAVDDAGPAWTSDGTRILFWSQRSGNGDLYVINADGTGEARITTDPQEDADPAVRP